ncbi:MAG: metallopeptidase TldD-related protein, partial [Desulfurococcaceae archaeon]|nr:metallopeptidase TldD-related protein [Desulfurococcaceae archaeon]
EKCGELAEGKIYRGNIEIGREYPEVEEVSKINQELCSEARGYNVTRCEIVITLRTVKRTIIRDQNDIASETKRIVEVEIGMVSQTGYGLYTLTSEFKVFIPWNPRDVIKSLDSLFREVVNRVLSVRILKPLKPYMYGRNTVILDHRSAAALLHEISHILDASYLYSRNIIGHKLSSDDVEVYDDPYNTDSPSIRFFDDEGVATRRRSLVENGVVRDLHHTRLTAKIAGSEPGSAYGLFHNPIPFHTTIIMKPGDWKYEEMLEDTKRGLYIVGIVMGTLEEGYVRLVPEYGYIIEDGELKDAVKIREIKIPFSSLKTINAISKEVKVRTSYEKYWCVSEIAPMLRLEAYIQ